MKSRKTYGTKNAVGKTICYLRKVNHMRQKDLLAQLQLRGIDICSTSLSDLEGQNRSASDLELLALSEIFSVSLADLFSPPEQ